MGIRILLADDHLVVREGLKAILERHGLQPVGEASDGREAVRLAAKLKPEVALLDISMPSMNGLDAAREIHEASPATKTVILTKHSEDPYVVAALKAGVRGYVLKSQAATDLLQAIQQVCRGQIYLSPGISGVVVEALRSKTDASTDPLSPRELQVLQLIGEGKSTKEVAQVLRISVKTAESHRTRLMQKLDIHELASLVRYAIRRGLIEA